MNIAALPASHGSKWFSDAYRNFFKKDPLLWIVIFFVYFILLSVLAILPILGSLAATLLHPIFLAGIMYACREVENGRELKLDMLFAGFKTRFSELITVGVLNLLFSAVALVISVGVGLLAFGAKWEDLKNGSFGSGSDLVSTIMIGSLVLTIAAMAFTLVIMAFWFAPLLVFFENMTPMDAIKQSFQGCVRNILPFTMLCLVAFLWGILAAIPLGLGFIVFIPVITISDYTSYKEIFKPARE